uniref:Secreted protein n=1 Tax=Steinernema glaseri TaxID=37863 RepID=A0A1I7Z1S4_9BILA
MTLPVLIFGLAGVYIVVSLCLCALLREFGKDDGDGHAATKNAYDAYDWTIISSNKKIVTIATIAELRSPELSIKRTILYNARRWFFSKIQDLSDVPPVRFQSTTRSSWQQTRRNHPAPVVTACLLEARVTMVDVTRHCADK